MEDDDDLFGDVVDLPRITRGGKAPTRDLMVKEAWQTWVTVSQRPKSSKPPRRFDREYREMLDAKFSHNDLLECVRAAVHIPQYKRDPEDINRVIAVLTNYNKEAQARSAMMSENPPVYLWEWDNVDPLVPLDVLEGALGTDQSLWTRQDQERAGIIVMSMKGPDVHRAAEIVRTYLGQPSIFPSDLIAYSRLWKSGKKVRAKAQQGRDSYDAGAVESQALKEMNHEVDIYAERLLLKGCPLGLIKDYHDQAPDGYWDAVEKLLDDNLDLDYSDAYEALREKWEWHPENREEPSY